MDLIPFTGNTPCLESYIVKITSRSRIIYWIIIGAVVAGIALLPFIYVDVSVQARGYFQTDIENQVVSAPIQGKVVYVSVHNGKRVSRGDTLLIIGSETVRAQQSSVLKRIAENNASISDLETLAKLDTKTNPLMLTGLATQRYRAEFANLRNQHSIQFQKYLKKIAEHERTKLLFGQEIVPEVDFENSLFVLNSERDNLSQILLIQKTLWDTDLTIRRNEALKLMAELEETAEGFTNRIILSPVNGEIIQSTDIQTGSIVNTGQKVAEISPGGELLVTCFVRPADIGMIHENQPVKIQVDAFNYNEWGMLDGKIIDISDDMIVENGSTACFRVKCKPQQTFLSLKNGHRAGIKKGMSVNTRIVVIKRSLFNLLTDKAAKWFNPYTYNNKD